MAEQERIVAQVDALLTLCDELEARQEHRGRAAARFRRSALHRLTASNRGASTREAWEQLDANWETLTDCPEGVAEVRKAILQVAVQGKLVRQDSADEPAMRLIEELATRRGRPEQGLATEPRPELPIGWSWASFGEASINRDSERVPLRRADRALRPGPYDYYGASGVIDRIDDYLFDGELLLIGEDGANLVSRSTPIAFIASGQFWVNNHAHVVDSVSPAAVRYLALFINSIDLRPHLTGIAQPKLNQARLNRIPVPIPPLEEQQRIVAAVDRLMAACEIVGRALELRVLLSSALGRSAAHALVS